MPSVDELLAVHLHLVERTARQRRLDPASIEWGEAVSAGYEELWRGCEALAAGLVVEKTEVHYLTMRLKRAMIDSWRARYGRKGERPRHQPLDLRHHDSEHHSPHEHALSELHAETIIARLVEVDYRMPYIATQLAAGRHQKEIADDLGISSVRVSKIISKAREYLGGSIAAALAVPADSETLLPEVA